MKRRASPQTDVRDRGILNLIDGEVMNTPMHYRSTRHERFCNRKVEAIAGVRYCVVRATPFDTEVPGIPSSVQPEASMFGQGVHHAAIRVTCDIRAKSDFACMLLL